MNRIDSSLIAILSIILILVYIALSMHLPVSIYTSASYDDAWYIAKAESMLRGQWMGAYNHMTLIKGPAYAYFLAINNLLGLPITLSIAALYVAACATVVSVLRRAGMNMWLLFAIFALLLFQPALFPTRIVRDNIYPSLSLITFAGVAYIALEKNVPVKTFNVLIFGLVFGVFWITREEGIWVIPGLMVLVFYKLFRSLKLKKEAIRTSILFIIFFVSAAIPFVSTALVNKFAYGAFQVVDVKSPEFVRVLNSLNNVVAGKEIPFVPVPHTKREAIYEISPAFKELKNFFEDTENGWSEPGCLAYPHTCGDYAGGWFMWALRDGVRSLGYYSSPERAAQFYNKISAEIDLACRNEVVACRNSRVPYMPNITNEALMAIPSRMIDAIGVSLYLTDVPMNDGPSWEPIERLDMIRYFLGNPRIVSPQIGDKITVNGWYYHQTIDKWFHLVCNADGNTETKTVKRRNSPDIATHFNNPDAVSQRFTFQVLTSENCEIIFDDSENPPISLNSLSETSDMSLNTNSGVFYIDTIESASDRRLYSDWSIAKKYLSAVYKMITPIIFIMGLIAISGRIILRFVKKYHLDGLAVVAISLWVIYFSRVTLVVLVDVLSFPAILYIYLMPSFPILLLAAFTSMGSFVNTTLNSASPNRVTQMGSTSQQNPGEIV